ncbi:MAG: DUF4345 domain-containing protein [Hyphomicrobiales bacterium]|nr:DUF4345 domain-containing protein [Hyphomicrobiales bacterium]
MIEFVLPQTNGEWLAWISAVYLVVNGLLKMLAPDQWTNFLKIRIIDDNGHGLAMMRGPMGGGNLGLGLAVLILHPQPLLYIAIGGMFAFMAIGRILSIILDQIKSTQIWISLIIEALLGFFTLAYAFGLIP